MGTIQILYIFRIMYNYVKDMISLFVKCTVIICHAIDIIFAVIHIEWLYILILI